MLGMRDEKFLGLIASNGPVAWDLEKKQQTVAQARE